jgi:hypothetical protein
MKKGDTALTPQIPFSATKAEIEALANPIEGMEAYATDTNKKGLYTGAAWVWDGGGSGGGVESVTGDGVDNTDPLNPVLTFPTPAEIGAIAIADAYVHPNHSGDVTSVGDGAQTIAANAVTLAKLATQAAQSILVNATGGIAVPTAMVIPEQRLIGRITGGSIVGLTGAGARLLVGIPFTAKTGLILSNSTGDAANDVKITAGYMMDSTDVEYLQLADVITKRLDANWSVGNDAGGLDTGSEANSTWYHVWLIKRSDTGVVDVLFSLSATAPTMPASYDYKRRIGSVYNGSGGAIRSFYQYGNRIEYNAAATDFRDLTTGTSTTGAAFTCSVPTGVKVLVLGAAVITPASAGWVSFFDPDASASTIRNYCAYSPNTSAGFSGAAVYCNTSAQLRYYVANGAADWYTNGYEELWQT